MNEPIVNNRVRKITHTISWNTLKNTVLSATALREEGKGIGAFDGGAFGFFVYL